MQEITMFHMKTCPYCVKAKGFIETLLQENPKYGEIKINYIDEQVEVELANSYDYYYVPTFYVNGEKLHEGAATLEDVREVFKAALK